MDSPLAEAVHFETGFAPARPLPRILVVDDEPLVLRVTASILLSACFAVIPVQSGEEALDKLQTESFDLIVTDYRMSGKSGADVAIGAHHTCPATPVMLMTGMIDDVPDWMRRGDRALPIVRKPFLKAELLQAVKLALPA